MREKYTLKDINRISEFQFFEGNEEEFNSKIRTKSVLAYGKFSEKTPLITIIIPTYKRVETLKQAVYGALNQVDFDDYEILIVDNEGENIEIETETMQLIKLINSSKVIYYRHEKSIPFRMEHAINLARTKWICILHDDDILSVDALNIMNKVILKHPHISWISCKAESFQNEDEKCIIQRAFKTHKAAECKIIHYPPQYCCTGYNPGWLGALINRKNFVDMGGMPTLWLGAGDFMMQGKYAYKYGAYLCKTDESLYYYRQWTGQISSGGTIEWFNNYIEEYLYYRYCARKFYKFTRKYWEYVGWHLIKDKIYNKNTGFYQLDIDEELIRELVNVPAGWSKRGVKYKISRYFLYADIIFNDFKSTKLMEFD